MNRQDLEHKAKVFLELKRRESVKDFWAFCIYMDPVFFNRRPFLHQVADAFMRVEQAYSNKTIRRLAVSMPPRAGKSYISSLFIAWMLAKYPEDSVMRNCCTATLYDKLSYDTRSVILSAKFQSVFPNVRLSRDKRNLSGWNLETSKQVGYFGGGVGGTVIGFGASLLAMTDDLYKSLEDALSDNNNEKTWSWKQGTHDSRIEGNCCIIDIGTRWSENDVLGRMEASGKYDEIMRIAALDDNDETFCADVHTTEYYHELRLDTDESIWEAEYMQNPIEAKGLLFPKVDLKRFRLSDIEGKTPDGIIGATDVADKGNDDFCTPFGWVFGDRIFLKEVLFTKDPVEVTEPRLSQMIIDTKCDKMRIEANNGGRIFTNNVKKNVVGKCKCDIQARMTTKNKETRILMKSGWIKNHIYFLDDADIPKGSDYSRFFKQLTGYKKEGGNDHDDAPDGLTILAELAEFTGLTNLKPKKKVARGV